MWYMHNEYNAITSAKIGELICLQSCLPQMDANNLAVCFSPTLFSASSVPKLSPIAHRGSFRRTVVNHSPNLATNREITEAVVSICFWPSFQGPSLYVKLQASSVRYPEIQFWNGYITP